MNRECNLWTGAVNPNGYGKYKGKYAHRLAWEFANSQPIPSNMCVMHTCDVRLCIEPSHLMLGTKSDNTLDRHAKGRSRRPALNEELAELVREQHDEGLSVDQLSERYDVHPWSIYKIVKYMTYNKAVV